jgi:hypothetical protein
VEAVVTPVIVQGAAELAAKTDRMAQRIEHPSGANLAPIFQRRVEQRFSSSGEGSWAGHSAATVERWGAHSVLRLTGALQSAMTHGRVEGSGVSIEYRPDAPFYGAIVDRRRRIIPEGDSQLTGEVADELARYVMGAE